MKNVFFAAALLCVVVLLPAQDSPRDKPAWTVRKPADTGEMSYFTSVVDEYAAEDEALRSVVNNVNNAVANSIIVYIRSSVSERSRSTESRDEFSINIETDSFTDIIVSGIHIETYSEAYSNRNGQRRYRAWALAAVSKAQAEENRRIYLETIAKRYTLDSAVQGDSLAAALSAYGGVYEALLHNPLHATIAVYGEGQSLFEYCRQRIRETADSLFFDDIPPQSLRKGGVLTLPVRVSSSLFSNAAALVCTVTVRSGNRILPGPVYTTGSDNSFVLRLPTAALEAGTYQVHLELGMGALPVTRNPAASFSLEILPAQAEISFGGETLSGAEQRLLSQAVQEALQRYRVPLAGGCEFRVTLDTRTRREPLAGTRLLLWDVSLSLNSAGSVVFQSRPERITELSRDQALALAAEHIRNNRDFWTGAARVMNSKE